ncbi:hypothetical protein SAMN05421780_101105 [Flexibacter flexilis DSM 6793]|uniref:Uncharacterized protein n=1 Tax=Flexibacter flexilis DSM 6793 TaxID=927664 RepID=A0A1I1DBB4_9BACT|nr:hypothetical protein [Flexibacter flexilis]SFB72319.1 hypothetical protein SAMN05421780_101105 [Flexibacter flexilis DSM 6793]
MSIFFEKNFPIHASLQLIDVSNIVSKLSFCFVKELPANDKMPLQHIYSRYENGDKQVFIYFNDHLLGVEYFCIRGLNEESVIEAGKELCESIKVYTVEELWEEYQSCADESKLASIVARFFVLGMNGFDKGLLLCYSQFIRDKREPVWETTRMGISYLGWIEFKPLLEDEAKESSFKGNSFKELIDILERNIWSKI